MKFLVVRLIILCACFLGAKLSAAADALPREISAVLKQHGLPESSLSLRIVDARQDKPLLDVNTTEARNPASVIKLVTSVAALDILGPGHLWQTSFLSKGKLNAGVLSGDIYLRSSGDPLILVEDFLGALAALRQRGVEKILGDLVIDNSFFELSANDRKPLDGQQLRVYNSPPDATVVNFRATRFSFVPNGKSVAIIAEPPASNLKIVNKLRLAKGACRGAHRRTSLSLKRSGNEFRVVFSGNYPFACGERQLTRAVIPSGHYVYGVFQAMWRLLGGEFDGGFRLAATPEDARLLFTRDSRPLFDTLRGINKYSNNQMARSLLMSLGAARYGAPGSAETGRLAIGEWLTEKGLLLPSLKLVNGSGLSRQTRISALDLDRILAYAYRHPLRAELLASMSLTGVDGSTRKRLKDDRYQGRYRIKTGLLRGVRGAAGFGVTARGTNVRISILQNHKGLGYNNGNAVQDAVIRWVNENL